MVQRRMPPTVLDSHSGGRSNMVGGSMRPGTDLGIMAKVDISYQESPDRLANRIRAHKLFGNVEIGDWIDAFLARRHRRDIFDLGCGDGNHLELYLRHVGGAGTVTGLDRDASLIAPTPNNVMELYEFNERVTGRRVDDKTLRRTERIVKEFLPLALEIFGRVQAEVIGAVLTFPNRDEFIRYFCSTLLYEEIAEREGLSPAELAAYCPATGQIPVSKEMVAVIATKSA